MKRASVLVALLLLPICGACGSGNGTSGDAGADTNATAQSLLEQCVVGDVQDLSQLLDLVQNLLDQDSGGPLPEFNLIAGLFTGTFPWTLDVDQDGTTDISGTLKLTDAQGDTIAGSQLGDLLGDLVGGNLSDLDLEAFFASLPDGTAVHLGFEADSGDGTFSVTFSGGAPSDVYGSGTFQSGACSLEFDFDDISPDALFGDEGFGVAEAAFELDLPPDTLTGTVALDGTNVAVVTTQLNGGAEEVFRVDLETGALVE